MLKNNQSGASMIEVLGVLGIVGIVATGFFATVSKVHDRYLQSQVVSQIRDLQKSIRVRYSAMSDYSEVKDANVAKLISEKTIPNSLIVGSNKIAHAYGGNVKLEGSKYEYKITFSSLTKGACMDLATLDWSVNGTSDLVKFQINGTPFSWTNPLLGKLPVDMITAGKKCVTNKINMLVWTFQ